MDQADTMTFSPGPAEAQPVRLSWRHPKGLLGLSVANFVLRILTLGIYNFWGKTEVRRRIWSAVRLEGEPLQYTGTGKELFLGFLIVFGAVVIPIMLVSVGAAFAFGPESTAFDVFQFALYGALFLLTGVAVYRAQRYRLSRTFWRGIRGGLAGRSRDYAWAYFWTGLLIPLTAGWIVPWRSTKLQGMITRDMRFGDRAFAFNAPSGPLYARFAVLWIAAVAIATAAGIAAYSLFMADVAAFDPSLGREFALTPPTVGRMLALAAAAYITYAIISAWYRARQINHFAAHTHFDKASFKSRVTAGGLIWIGVTNILLVIFTLGLLIPVAQARAARYLVENLEIAGGVSLGEIAQGADAGIRRGEGLAQAFDVDAF
jgi:uncharacterized membrane protein YjgN (DUF898 family)